MEEAGKKTLKKKATIRVLKKRLCREAPGDPLKDDGVREKRAFFSCLGEKSHTGGLQKQKKVFSILGH